MLDDFHNRLSAFLEGLDRLDQTDTDALKDAFMNEVIENGGTYAPPHNDARCLFEISLHDVTASGMSELLAIRNWRIAATARVLNPDAREVEADGFITVHPPCGNNHSPADAQGTPDAPRLKQPAPHLHFGIR